mmetsp:Transcript_11288/g.23899  ORF Transcript_11288/g.23899 Transcript_11288/m.23899 type:complete len:80 (-) Transcript_11288:90-329(-)
MCVWVSKDPSSTSWSSVKSKRMLLGLCLSFFLSFVPSWAEDAKLTEWNGNSKNSGSSSEDDTIVGWLGLDWIGFQTSRN